MIMTANLKVKQISSTMKGAPSPRDLRINLNEQGSRNNQHNVQPQVEKNIK